MEFHLIQNRKEKCHLDHIPFNVKGNGNIVFSIDRKTATDRLIAVQETGVSRHQGDRIEGPPVMASGY